MLCEICGKEDKLIKADIEGVILNVCDECIKFGKVVKEDKEIKVREIKPRLKEVIKDVVGDYSEIVKKRREELNLTQKELSRKINEKESVIQNIETGKLEPDFVLARKLEKFLNIKLVREYEEENMKIDFRDKNLTIGDLIKLRRKKNKT